MAAEQGLPAVLDALRRRWPLAVLVALPLALGVSAYARSVPAEYDAQTTVAFAPRPGAQIGADVVRVVLPRYVALLSAPATTQRVAAETGLPRELLAAADVAVTTETANLTVVVRDDGIGGACIECQEEASGLGGLVDRVEALGGTLSILSPEGAGTTLTAVFPLEPGL